MLSSSVWVQNMWFSIILSWHGVDNLCFWYCIECVFIRYEGNDALAEVSALDADVPQGGIAIPLFHDNDCLWIQFPHK